MTAPPMRSMHNKIGILCTKSNNETTNRDPQPTGKPTIRGSDKKTHLRANIPKNKTHITHTLSG